MVSLIRNKLKGRTKIPPPVSGQSSFSETTEDEFHDAEEALPSQTFMHPNAHPEGGLGFVDKQLLESQRAAVLQLMKEAGKKLLMGNIDLVNFSVPVKMFEARSYLQKLADVWVYPRMLSQAADTSDPVERMKLVITWFVAGLQHVYQSWRKPFNPILGETWQAQLSDGTAIFMEQLSHHPPVTAFHMIGAGGKYTFHGISQPNVSFGANAIKTSAKGYRRLSFADGGCIEIDYPIYMMRGIVYTAMPRGDCSGTARFTDQQNRLSCNVDFGKIEGAVNPLLQRPDSFQGIIHSHDEALPASCSPDTHTKHTSVVSCAQIQPHAAQSSCTGVLQEKRRSFLPRPSLSVVSSALSSMSVSGRPEEAGHQTPMACCTGNWLSHLDWHTQRYWTLVEEKADRWQPMQHLLPSDCSRRLDLQTLLTGNVEAAQLKKVELENLQRTDAKIRKAAGSVG